jgi:hypothetical protein
VSEKSPRVGETTEKSPRIGAILGVQLYKSQTKTICKKITTMSNPKRNSHSREFLLADLEAEKVKQEEMLGEVTSLDVAEKLREDAINGFEYLFELEGMREHADIDDENDFGLEMHWERKTDVRTTTRVESEEAMKLCREIDDIRDRWAAEIKKKDEHRSRALECIKDDYGPLLRKFKSDFIEILKTMDLD